MSSSESLAGLNRTELYQACRRAGISVPASATRNELIAFLYGEGDEAPNVTDTWREGIIGFLNEYWSMLEAQLKCPAKNLRHPTNPNPKPCYGCVDAQVIMCVINDQKVEQLIQLHRKNK